MEMYNMQGVGYTLDTGSNLKKMREKSGTGSIGEVLADNRWPDLHPNPLRHPPSGTATNFADGPRPDAKRVAEFDDVVGTPENTTTRGRTLTTFPFVREDRKEEWKWT